MTMLKWEKEEKVFLVREKGSVNYILLKFSFVCKTQ